MNTIFYVIPFVFGLLIGSFLNVCIHRIPQKLSVAYPPSHCPGCGTALKPLDLIPLLSYLLCRGRCRYCKSKISFQYPLVELLNAILYDILFLKFGLTATFIKYAALISLLVVISFIDFKTQEIPDGLILFGLILGFVFNLLYHPKYAMINGTLGLLTGGMIFLLIAVLSGGAMGGGDIKLMGILGFLFGWKYILIITLLSFIIGAFFSLILIVLKIKGRKDYIPFGPFIAISAVVVMFYGTELLNWYLKTIAI